MDRVNYRPIGVIHTPFQEPPGTPIQPPAGKGVEGIVEVFPQYAEGLKDLAGFSHLILLYHFHLVNKVALQVKPFMDDVPHGVFATRAPARPNALGLSIVRLDRIEGNLLHIRDLDIVDGTPLLDIKPYVPEFDRREAPKIGWLEKNVRKLPEAQDDGRFQG